MFIDYLASRINYINSRAAKPCTTTPTLKIAWELINCISVMINIVLYPSKFTRTTSAMNANFINYLLSTSMSAKHLRIGIGKAEKNIDNNKLEQSMQIT
jgi:hypothetical protein